jgi:hypothetical protein
LTCLAQLSPPMLLLLLLLLLLLPAYRLPGACYHSSC